MRKRHAHATGPISRARPASPPAAGEPVQPDDAEREAMVREAAYFLYERRGCRPGHELDDWIDAEALIAAQFPRGDTRADEEGVEQISETPSESAPI